MSKELTCALVRESGAKSLGDDVALILPNMFDNFPYRGPKAAAASMYALARLRIEQLYAHDMSTTRRTCRPNYSCLHLRAWLQLLGVQSQRSSITTTGRNPPEITNAFTHLIKRCQKHGAHQAEEYDTQAVLGQNLLFLVLP